MWTGVMLALVLGQAKADAPVVRPFALHEYRSKALDKDAFIGEPNLNFQAHVQGSAVKDALKVGNLKVTEAVDDQKADLIMRRKKGDSFGPMSDQPEFRVIQQFDRDQNKDNLNLNFQLRAPGRTAKKISAKGSVGLVFGTATIGEFAKVKSLEGSTLKSEDLDALKLKVMIVKPTKDNSFGKPEQNVVIEVEGDVFPIIETEITLLDGAGKKMEGFYPQWQFQFDNDKGKPRRMVLNNNQNIPADAKLQIKYIKSAKIVTVPFEFKDVELP
jgi:hypothetical protein